MFLKILNVFVFKRVFCLNTKSHLTFGFSSHGKLAITVRRTDQSYKGDNKDRRTNLLDTPL